MRLFDLKTPEIKKVTLQMRVKGLNLDSSILQEAKKKLVDEFTSRVNVSSFNVEYEIADIDDLSINEELGKCRVSTLHQEIELVRAKYSELLVTTTKGDVIYHLSPSKSTTSYAEASEYMKEDMKVIKAHFTYVVDNLNKKPYTIEWR